jgi:pyruvate formate lyase activating enzyme
MKAALFYDKLEDGKVRCFLCPHNCIISEGKLGICGVRRNTGGVLYAETYEKVSAVHFDPIEKKPLYHFLPGRIILSIGSAGCNLSCSFCQNCDISQATVDDFSWFKHFTVGDIVDMAVNRKDNAGVSYTYNEPIIHYEYMLEIASEIKRRKMYNVMVTNGFINPEPLKKLIPVMDAFNIDLKAFTEEFYKKITKSSLKPVLDTLKLLHESGNHFEITNLIIPTLNDDSLTFGKMIDWIHKELGEYTVLHLSRYYPHYKMTIAGTPISTLERLYNIAREKLRYVYIGNVIGSEGQNTYCPACQNLLINRSGYFISVTGIAHDGKCRKCGQLVPNMIF